MSIQRARAALPVLFGGGGATYADKVLGYSPIAYWTLQADATDSSGNGYDGSASGVTFNSGGGPDGAGAAVWDGSTGHVDIYSAGLASAFDGTVGSVSLWAKANGAGVWSDNTLRRLLSFFVDSQNRIFFQKRDDATGNDLFLAYEANNVYKTRNTDVAPTDYFHLAITWSTTSTDYNAYYNGSNISIASPGIGAWTGSLDATQCVIGAGNTSNGTPWHGEIAHVAFFDTELSSGAIADLATV